MKLYLANCIQDQNNTRYPLETEIITLDDMQRAATKDHVSAKMKYSLRSNDNWLHSDCIMLDLDNTHSDDPDHWKTLDDVSDAFPDVFFFYVKSRNYMKVKTKTRKDGSVVRMEPREKHHLYFPLSKPYEDLTEYEQLMFRAAALFPYFDLGAAKPSQPFFGVDPAEGGEVSGDLCLDEFLARVSPEEIKASVEDYANKVITGDYSSGGDEAKKAVNKLCSYLGIQIAGVDEGNNDQETITFAGQDLEWEKVEQEHQINWFRNWAKTYNVELGNTYDINTKNHPHAVQFCVTCPWEENHTEDTGERQTVVIVGLDGKLSFLCRHEHCVTHGWKDFRAFHEKKNGAIIQEDVDPEKTDAENETVIKGLSQPVNFAKAYIAGLPELERELIRKILRKGGKLLITASSKAGKTQILVLLTIALSEGGLWLGTIQCEKAKVLFVNFELTPAQMYRRFESAYWAMKKSPVNSDFSVWNLKGQYDQIFPLDENFVPRLITIVKEQQFDVVVLDPIYKMFIGDENESKTIAEFCRQTDRIVQETGCSLIYSHHHSKGAQGQKSAIDRGSGSGVFGRDADAVLDFLEIEPKDVSVELEEGQSAYRIEIGGLRSFQMFPSFEVVSEFPLFVPRDGLKLAKAKYGCSDPSTNAKRGNAKKQQDRDKDINILREFVRFVVESGGTYSLDDAVEAMNKSKSTIREWVKMEGSGMEIHNNNLYLVSTSENNENE